jgi:hypothetical protein
MEGEGEGGRYIVYLVNGGRYTAHSSFLVSCMMLYSCNVVVL